jgi:exosome complex component RRP46
MVERPDSRTDNTELRAFSASQNILNRADGSAKFEFGKDKEKEGNKKIHLFIVLLFLGATSVLTSVNGPIDVSLRDEKLDEATVEVVVRPARGVSTTKERLMENTLRTAFAPIILAGMMPRTLIQIVVQILKDDGSALAAAANSITLALLDAGVPMRQMVGSVTCMIDEKTKSLILDPTTIELEVIYLVY